ncbi:MAG TPA: hypothetical protein VGF91_16600 [Solirubrobacteraceae bacterium]|jgi:hypothetical protein
MERNTETLSTRDLASPNEQGSGATMSEGDVRDPATPEGQPDVYDQAAPAAEGTRLPDDEQTLPPDEARTGVSAGERSVGADRPGAGLDTESGDPGLTVEDSPANVTQPVSTQDQDTEVQPHSNAAAASASNGGSLLPADMDATFQQRWKEIQTRFVDEPRGAVEDADSLVASLMQQLAEGFAKERERLEAQWGRGEDISTEDLRVALQRYRTFFQRLLST